MFRKAKVVNFCGEFFLQSSGGKHGHGFGGELTSGNSGQTAFVVAAKLHESQDLSIDLVS